MSDKQKVDELRGELESEKAADPVAGLADRATAMIGQAQQAANTARDQIGSQADALAAKIQQRPFVAIGIAAAIGYLLRRVTA